MKVCIQGFLGENHSWAYTNQNLARGLLTAGHQVDLSPTDSTRWIPADLDPLIHLGKDLRYTRRKNPIKVIEDKSHYHRDLATQYDMQLSYTAMVNFPTYLSRGRKNRFGIWCYEWPILPKDFPKYHQFVDYLLPPSQFAAQIFVDNKIPHYKIKVVPHGINLSDYQNTTKYPLKTKKQYKILLPIGQPHVRKRLEGALQAYCQAFTAQDDVCLIAKVSSKKKNKLMSFEIDIWEMLQRIYRQYPNHPEIELITDYVPNMVELYNACDIVFTLTYSECFYMPGLEAFGCNKLVIAPRYGGQLDFLNNQNSLLVEGKVIRAGTAMQYWTSSPLNTVFEAKIEDAVDKLRYAVQNYQQLIGNFTPFMQLTVKQYTWEQAVQQITSLCG